MWQISSENRQSHVRSLRNGMPGFEKAHPRHGEQDGAVVRSQDPAPGRHVTLTPLADSMTTIAWIIGILWFTAALVFLLSLARCARKVMPEPEFRPLIRRRRSACFSQTWHLCRLRRTRESLVAAPGPRCVGARRGAIARVSDRVPQSPPAMP